MTSGQKKTNLCSGGQGALPGGQRGVMRWGIVLPSSILGLRTLTRAPACPAPDFEMRSGSWVICRQPFLVCRRGGTGWDLGRINLLFPMVRVAGRSAQPGQRPSLVSGHFWVRIPYDFSQLKYVKFTKKKAVFSMVFSRIRFYIELSSGCQKEEQFPPPLAMHGVITSRKGLPPSTK